MLLSILVIFSFMCEGILYKTTKKDERDDIFSSFFQIFVYLIED